AHGEIDSAIPMAREVKRVLSLAGAGVEHARAGRKLAREGGDGVLNLHFEVQNVQAEEPGKTVGQRGVTHRTRASIITLDPARHMASKAANGKAPSTSAKYARSLASLTLPDSATPRTRRAI